MIVVLPARRDGRTLARYLRRLERMGYRPTILAGGTGPSRERDGDAAGSVVVRLEAQGPDDELARG